MIRVFIPDPGVKKADLGSGSPIRIHNTGKKSRATVPLSMDLSRIRIRNTGVGTSLNIAGWWAAPGASADNKDEEPVDGAPLSDHVRCGSGGGLFSS